MKFKQIIVLISFLLAVCTINTTGQETSKTNALIKKGIANYQAQNYKTAYYMFQKAMLIDPDNSEASQWFWKMKNEYNISDLKDRGPVLSQQAEKTESANLKEDAKSIQKEKVDTSQSETVKEKDKPAKSQLKEKNSHADKKNENGDVSGRIKKLEEKMNLYFFILASICTFLFALLILSLLLYRIKTRKIHALQQAQSSDPIKVPRTLFHS